MRTPYEKKPKLASTVIFRAATGSRGGVPWWMWAGLAALVLLSVYSVQVTRRIENELRLAQEQAALVAREREEMGKKVALAQRERSIVMDQASVQIAMPAASKDVPAMRAYWHAQLGIVVAGANIPAPPSNRALQLWLIPRAAGSKPQSAGLLEQRPGGSCVGLVPEPKITMSDTKALAITEEPAGGSARPTSSPRWVGGVT